MRRIVRNTLALVLALAALASAPAASAYMDCRYVVTVYASGGQTCEQICSFYDNVTGEFRGTISREWQC